MSFITELLAIEHMLPFQDQVFIDSTSDFLNCQGLDLLHIASEAVTSGQDIFRVAHLVTLIFAKLNDIAPSSLLGFLTIYDEKTKNDLMNGQLAEPIRKRVACNKEWAFNLEEVIVTNDCKGLYRYLLPIYLGLSDADRSCGFSKIQSAYSSEDHDIKAVGLRCLGLLGSLPDHFRGESFAVLIEGVDSTHETIAASAAFSLSRLYQECPELGRKRIELSKSPSTHVRFEILKQIHLRQEMLDSDDIQIVKNLCAYDLKYRAITNSLDAIIHSLANKGHTEIVLDILTEWVTARSHEEIKQYDFTDMFPCSISGLLENHTLLNRIITEWLNSEDLRFHLVLEKMFFFIGTHNVTNASLDLEILNSFQYDDFVYIVRKILGFVHNFEISINLILSVLDLSPLSHDTACLVKSVLTEHIGTNHLVQTTEKLNQELLKATVGTIKNAVLNETILELQQRRKEISALDHCNELIPDPDHQTKLDKALRDSLNIAFAKAREKSVLLGLFSRVNIIEGSAFFSFLNGEYRDPSPMQQFSHELVFPKNDLIDEVGASLERFNFRIVKRGE
ncbi:MAG: hypothetical protein H3C47_01645 [Candidatus Cloacimonetes bacterium]|nr:hypothetical protein [Candidatus Cloacimonadota bacterium]